MTVVCKAKKKKSETRYECSKCLVALHVPDCFRVYHTKIKNMNKHFTAQQGYVLKSIKINLHEENTNVQNCHFRLNWDLNAPC
jgi:hypothetical protein